MELQDIILDPEIKTSTIDKERINELTQCLGEDGLNHLVETFLHETTRNISDLKNALAIKDLNSIQEVAHTLKGGASTLGVPDMSEICRKLEYHEQLGFNFQEISALLNSLVDEFEAVKAAFALSTDRQFQTSEGK